MSNKATGYDLSKHWWNFAYTNKEVRPVHSALYFFIIDLYNRLTQPSEFGLPTNDTMQVLGISNYRTYAAALFQLEEWKFIQLVERSTNQYTSNKIALVKNTKALPKALPKALHEAITEALPEAPYQSITQSTTRGIVVINKPNNLITDKTDNYVINKLRVGTSFFDLTPFEYLKQYHQISLEQMLMQYKIPEADFQTDFNNEYQATGFENSNHILNAAKLIFKNLAHGPTKKNQQHPRPNNIHSGGRKDFNAG